MKSSTRWGVGVLGVAVLAALTAVSIFGGRVLLAPKETYQYHVYSAGHRALFMCSGYFIAKRKPDDIRRWEIGYGGPGFDAPGEVTLDEASQSATGSTARGFIKRRAAYREGSGCVLVAPNASVEQLAKLPSGARIPPAQDPSRLAWPNGDLIADGVPPEGAALPPGFDRSRLDAVMDAAFDGKTYLNPAGSWMPDAKTLGLVILYKGQIVAERYSQGWGPHTQYRTYSAAKSFTNLMVGARVHQSKFDIDAPVLFPEWYEPNDPRRAITTRHLLNMSSGLACDGGGTTSLKTYFAGGRSAAKDAAQRELLEKPGTHWCYSNFDTISVARAVGRTFERQADYFAFAYGILNRIGMHDTVLETDVDGNFIMSSQIWTTPRDLARFGLLYLNEGVWNGERLLPEGWVTFTRTPAPAPARSMGTSQLPSGYGAQFWLYNEGDSVPADTFTAAGNGGQWSTIVPSREVVIARMGLQNWKHRQFVADVLAALPTNAQ